VLLRAAVPALMAVLVQSPSAQAPVREVGRTYWELVRTTEIWVRLMPENIDGTPPLVSLVVRATFPGIPPWDPYAGAPKWPTGQPARLTVTAEPLPRTLIRELALGLVVDGRTLDLTAPDGRYRNLPCLVASEDCAPNGVEAELEPRDLRSLVTARAVVGKALGFPIRLVPADLRALGDFAARVGLAGSDGPTVKGRERSPLSCGRAMRNSWNSLRSGSSRPGGPAEWTS
jgi:hypothetical protein